MEGDECGASQLIASLDSLEEFLDSQRHRRAKFKEK